MNQDGEDLLAHVRAFVREKVPPKDVETTTEIIVRLIVLLMSKPEFYNHLRIVMNLQAENQALRQRLSRLMDEARTKRLRSQAVKAGMRKTAAAKATPVKKAAPVKGSTAANRKAFQKGVTGN